MGRCELQSSGKLISWAIDGFSRRIELHGLSYYRSDTRKESYVLIMTGGSSSVKISYEAEQRFEDEVWDFHTIADLYRDL
jgi:hypothetical protein